MSKRLHDGGCLSGTLLGFSLFSVISILRSTFVVYKLFQQEFFFCFFLERSGAWGCLGITQVD